MELCLHFDESAIGYWASRYLDSQRLQDRENEERLIGLKKRIQQNGEMSRDELYDVQTWKSTQGLKLLDEISEDQIRERTKAAFDAKDDWEKLDILMELNGISYARASVVLHFYDCAEFPIVDRYANWAVDKNGVVRNAYSKEFWLEYVRFCRDIATRNGFSMRTLDRALWAFGWYYWEF